MTRRSKGLLVFGVLALASAGVFVMLEHGHRPADAGSRSAANAVTVEVPVPIDSSAAGQPATIESHTLEAAKERAAAPAPAAMNPKPDDDAARGFACSQKTETSGRIFGTWTGRDGKPVAHSGVRIFALGPNGMPVTHLMVATGADGAYFAFVEPGRHRVRFESEDRAVSVATGEECRVDHRAPPGAEVRVKISGSGVQAHNALISLSSRGGADDVRQRLIARTDVTGRADFQDVRPGPITVTGQLVRTSGGAIRVAAPAEVPAGGSIEVELLAPAGALALTVFARAGGPVPGAVALVRTDGNSSAAARGVTGASGQLLLDGLPPGPAVLQLSHPGYAPMVMTVAITASPEPMLLVLDEGASIPVRVTDDKKHPMAIILRARVAGEVEGREWEWRLDAEGRGQLSGIPIEPLDLEFLAAGFDPIRLNTARDLLDKSLLELVFKRRPGVPAR